MLSEMLMVLIQTTSQNLFGAKMGENPPMINFLANASNFV